MYKFLFFDPAITGHHSEYIGHIVNYLSDNEIKDKDFFFIVHPEFSKNFPDIFEKASRIKNVTWQQITHQEFAKFKKGSRIKRYIAEFRVLHTYAKRFNVDHVCCLSINTLQYISVFFKTSYTLSGILFLQFYRLPKNTMRQKITYSKRYYASKLSRLNSKLNRIFILNDEKTTAFMNKEFKTTIFKMLPDPIPQLQPQQNFDIYQHYEIDHNRKIFLHIGALGNRKGTVEVVESVRFLKKENQDKIAILLVGKAGSDVEANAILMALKESKTKSDVPLIWDRRFVPSPVMKSLFDQCKAVLMPYKNAEFSSGILGHAAAANKPVIATGSGLIRELVEEFNLGVLLDTTSAETIASKIEELLFFDFNSGGQDHFLESHHPDIFAKMLIDN